jgi:hypothetical protein
MAVSPLAALRNRFFPEKIGERLDSRAVASHLAKALISAPVSPNPWPYVFVENAFPEDSYIAISEALELSDAHFKDQVHTGDRKVFHGSYEERQEFRIAHMEKDGTGNIVAKNIPPLWLDLYDVFTSKIFFDAMRQKFDTDYRRRFGEFMHHRRFQEYLDSTLLVTRHRENYYIGPHTDRSEKVITCIFNFPEHKALEHIGTAMYAAKQPGFTSDGLVHLNPDDFDFTHTVPFRPNTALIFARTDASFHGVQHLTQASLMGSPRYNVQYNLWDWGRRP